MTRMQKMYNELKNIKKDLDYLEQNDAPGNHEAIDNKMHDVIASVATITDDLLSYFGGEVYRQQLEGFLQHLDDVMQKADTSEEEMDKFYDEPWTVTFCGKTLEIGNGAVAYQGMYDLVKEILETDV